MGFGTTSNEAPHGNLPASLTSTHGASGAALSFVIHEKSDVGSSGWEKSFSAAGSYIIFRVHSRRRCIFRGYSEFASWKSHRERGKNALRELRSNLKFEVHGTYECSSDKFVQFVQKLHLTSIQLREKGPTLNFFERRKGFPSGFSAQTFLRWSSDERSRALLFVMRNILYRYSVKTRTINATKKLSQAVSAVSFR